MVSSITLKISLGTFFIYVMKACGREGISIVVVIMEEGKVQRVGKGRGSEEVERSEVVEEE